MSHLSSFEEPFLGARAAGPLGVGGEPAARVSGSAPPLPAWTPWQRVLFRFSFITIALLIIPLTPSWYQRLFNLRSPWDLFGLFTSYRSDFIVLASDSYKWGFGGFVAWGAAALGGVAGAAVWTWLARRSRRTEYRALDYWLRLVVRYRIAFGLLAFGFMKFYPTQMPYPSQANLQTYFGDYTTFKLYWQSVGIVTWYQVVIGIVEVGAAVLFFFRGTVALGCVIVIGVFANIVHANLAYDGGVHVYSAFFVLLSLYLLVPYWANVWRLLVRREDVAPKSYAPVYATAAGRRIHLGFKTALILLFTVGYGYERYVAYYVTGMRKEPLARGIAGLEGVYDVTEFRLDGKDVPYSSDDPVRWQQATFERYVTFAYQVNQAFPVNLANGAPALRDSEKRYEIAGVAGGWRYWYYVADEQAGTLQMQDRNNDLNALAGRRHQLADGSRAEPQAARQTWSYTRPSPDRVVIDGRDDEGRELHVVLDRRKVDLPVTQSRAVRPGDAPIGLARR